VGTLSTHHPLPRNSLLCSTLSTPLHVGAAPRLHCPQDALFRSRYVLPEPCSPSPRTHCLHWPNSVSLPCRVDQLKMLKLQGLDTILVTAGPNGSAGCVGEGREAAQQHGCLFRVGSWALSTRPTPRCTRGWLQCCSVEACQSGMALRSFGRAATVHATLLSSATASPQRWAVAWRV
jgi:hypothetical protein